MGPLHAARAASERALIDAGQGLRSERLVLRRFTLDDLPLLLQLNADPQVMRWLGGVMNEQQTAEMLQTRILGYYDANPGLGIWATLLRDGGECIGFHLLNHLHGETLIQVGYRLFPRHWAKGYATEMTVTLLDYGYRQLGLEVIAAITALDNHASQHVLHKAGLERLADRAFPHPAYAPYGPMAYFERSAPEWLAAHP
ncbi:MAG: GNAT family N-acetyltransferase [Nevskia sp.]|nr:GNAT family N-acetyltransferase [Nevskia sp.]